jgi:osmotically-inducible protein OsmY
VRDGVVDLNGVIFDEKECRVLRVAAENPPGVRAVENYRSPGSSPQRERTATKP